MSVFMDRSRRAGRFLEWKVRIFVVGATLAVGGIYLDESWLTGIAIVVLVSGALLRFLPGAREEDAGEDGDSEEDGDDPAEPRAGS